MRDCLALLMRALAVGLLLLWSAPVRGQRQASLRKWAGQLGSRRFEVREAAQKKLTIHRRAAAKLLRRALDSRDAEVRRRARQILSYRSVKPSPCQRRCACRVRPRNENAILGSLIWLRCQQEPRGLWSSGETWADPCITGLATLAFLGAGHTHRFGRFKEEVKKCIRELLRLQQVDGRIGSGKSGNPMLNHVLATLALSECYLTTKSPLVLKQAEKAVAYLIRQQDPKSGWSRFDRDGTADPDTNLWALLALYSARNAELKPKGFERAMRLAMTAVPLRARALCLMLTGTPKTHPEIKRETDRLLRNPPRSADDPMQRYLSTLLMFNMGGRHWRGWNKHLIKTVLDTQLDHRYWKAAPFAGLAGTQVYATALNTMTLQLYYRYARVFR